VINRQHRRTQKPERNRNGMIAAARISSGPGL
jgi:hypothetical protein